jgi:hypothetical protein
MPKTRKPSTTRKPPEPSTSHEPIEGWIESVMPGLHPIVQRLDELIRETISDLQFAVKWKKAYYGLPERGWIIEMVAYDVSVNVVFLGGADFDAPPPLGDTTGAATSRSRPWRRRSGPSCATGSSRPRARRAGSSHGCRDRGSASTLGNIRLDDLLPRLGHGPAAE